MAAKKTAKKNAKTTAKKIAKKSPAKKSVKRSAAKRGALAKATSPTIVHWEIQSQDAMKLHRFYSELFGWKIDANNPMKYGMVASQRGKEGINGGIGGSEAPGSRVLVYASVDDIDQVLSKAEKLGGKTLMPRTDIGMVIMGIFQDVEGNQFGLVEG